MKEPRNRQHHGSNNSSDSSSSSSRERGEKVTLATALTTQMNIHANERANHEPKSTRPAIWSACIWEILTIRWCLVFRARNNHRIQIICFACVCAIVNCWTCAANFTCWYIGLMYAKPTCALSFICSSMKIRARIHAGTQYSIWFIWPQAPELTNEMAFTRKCTTSTAARIHPLPPFTCSLALTSLHFSQCVRVLFATGTYQFRTKWETRARSLPNKPERDTDTHSKPFSKWMNFSFVAKFKANSRKNFVRCVLHT